MDKITYNPQTFVDHFIERMGAPKESLIPDIPKSLTEILELLGPRFVERVPGGARIVTQIKALVSYPIQGNVVDAGNKMLACVMSCDQELDENIIDFYSQNSHNILGSSFAFSTYIPAWIENAMKLVSRVALEEEVEIEEFNNFQTAFGLTILKDFLSMKSAELTQQS